jgi:hypothetical protein
MTATLARPAATLYVSAVGELSEYMPTQPVVRLHVPRFPVVSLVEHWLWTGYRIAVYLYVPVWGGAVGGLILQELT